MGAAAEICNVAICAVRDAEIVKMTALAGKAVGLSDALRFQGNVTAAIITIMTVTTIMTIMTMIATIITIITITMIVTVGRAALPHGIVFPAFPAVRPAAVTRNNNLEIYGKGTVKLAVPLALSFLGDCAIIRIKRCKR